MIRAIGKPSRQPGSRGLVHAGQALQPWGGVSELSHRCSLAELLGRTAYAIIYKSKFLFDELIRTQLLV